MSNANSTGRYGRLDPGPGFSREFDYTASSSIDADKDGALLTNLGAVVNITLTLPAAVAGMEFAVMRIAPYAITIAPAGGEYIGGGPASCAYVVNTRKLAVFSCIVAGTWEIIFGRGTDEKNILDYGADPSGATDSLAAWNLWVAALNSATGLLGVLPPGTFKLTASPNKITSSSIFIEGQGEQVTFVNMVPAATMVAFDFDQGGGSGAQWGVSNLTITSSNTTYTKTGIKMTDHSGCYVSHIKMVGLYGGDSVGLHLNGRADSTFDNLVIAANVPIRLSHNPNDPVNDADHLEFRDLYLLPYATAPSTLAHASILIDPDVVVSNVSFSGRQGWVGGKYGIYHVADGTAGAASWGLALHNVRCEQLLSGGETYHLEFHASTPLQEITMVNCRSDELKKGGYFKNVYNIVKIGCHDTTPGATADMMEVVATTSSMSWVGQVPSVTGTMTLPAALVSRRESRLASYILPHDAVWNTSAAPRMVYGSGTPEGSVTAPVGSIFQRSDGAYGTSVYVKENGSGTAGWKATGGLTGSATFNPADLADGTGETTTVTVTGAALGDYAVASFSLDLQGLIMTAWVSAADTVSVRFQHEVGGANINLASGTLRARVFTL